MKKRQKSAVKMFEDLGYTLTYEAKTYEDYEKSRYGTITKITIYKNAEYGKLSYPINRDWDELPEIITEAEDRAIHKRLKEISEEK